MQLTTPRPTSCSECEPSYGWLNSIQQAGLLAGGDAGQGVERPEGLNFGVIGVAPLFLRPEEADPALAQHHHAVGHPFGQTHVVRHHNLGLVVLLLQAKD